MHGPMCIKYRKGCSKKTKKGLECETLEMQVAECVGTELRAEWHLDFANLMFPFANRRQIAGLEAPSRILLHSDV